MTASIQKTSFVDLPRDILITISQFAANYITMRTLMFASRHFFNIFAPTMNCRDLRVEIAAGPTWGWPMIRSQYNTEVRYLTKWSKYLEMEKYLSNIETDMLDFDYYYCDTLTLLARFEEEVSLFNRAETVDLLVRCGRRDVLDLIMEEIKMTDLLEKYFITSAIHANNVEYLDLINKNMISEYIPSVKISKRNPTLATIQYIHENIEIYRPYAKILSLFDWNEIAKFGRVDIVNFAIANKIKLPRGVLPIVKYYTDVAQLGQLLKLVQMPNIYSDLKLNSVIAVNLSCLKYLQECGIPINYEKMLELYSSDNEIIAICAQQTTNTKLLYKILKCGNISCANSLYDFDSKKWTWNEHNMGKLLRLHQYESVKWALSRKYSFHDVFICDLIKYHCDAPAELLALALCQIPGDIDNEMLRNFAARYDVMAKIT